MKRFIIINKIYLICIILVLFFSAICKFFLMDYINRIDSFFINLLDDYLINDQAIEFFKTFTNFGSALLLIGIVIIIMIFKKEYSVLFCLGLIYTYLLSVISKLLFMRERYLYPLIKMPKDYSFPSGHVMNSVFIYGLLIYVINKEIKNKYIKSSLIIINFVLILMIMFSRLYLKVHYFTDIFVGFVLGIICLLIAIRTFKKIGEKNER